MLMLVAFNAFGCKYDEEKLLAMAHSMVDEGLVQVGYNSIIFDDCFTQKERGPNGELLEGRSPLIRFHTQNILRGLQISRDSHPACEL